LLSVKRQGDHALYENERRKEEESESEKERVRGGKG
jgi:hypothetical protein